MIKKVDENHFLFGGKGDVFMETTHIAGNTAKETLCGKPMLSTNHSAIAEVQEAGCKDCIKIYNKKKITNKKLKSFTVVRIENGIIEAENLKEAEKIVLEKGFNIGYCSEKVVRENSNENYFWANLNVNKIEEIKNLSVLKNKIYKNSEMINGRPNLSKLTQIKAFKDFKEFKELIPNSNLEFEKLSKNAACNIPVLISIAESFYDTLKSENKNGLMLSIIHNCLWNIKNEENNLK